MPASPRAPGCWALFPPEGTTSIVGESNCQPFVLVNIGFCSPVTSAYWLLFCSLDGK